MRVRTTHFAETFDYKKPVNKIDGLFLNESPVYEFADPLQMPIERLTTFHSYHDELARGCDAGFLESWRDKLEEAVNAGAKPTDIARLLFILDEVRAQTPMANYLRLASVLFLVEGENPFEYDVSLANEKINSLEAALDGKKKNSFYVVLGRNMRAFGMSCPQEILTHSRKAEQRLSVYRSALNSLQFTASSNPNETPGESITVLPKRK